MTTTARRLPAHGERRCYMAGCQRPECHEAHKRYMKRYHLDRVSGIQRTVDARPARHHAQALYDTGWTQRQIADAAGSTRAVIQRLLASLTRTLPPDVATAILAIPLNAAPPAPTEPVDVQIDATGSTRRLRALTAIGYELVDIRAETGLAKNVLIRILHGQQRTVRTSTARLIAAAYLARQRTPGASNRARNRAAREGWHDPQWWEDWGGIDDPDFDPDAAEQPLKRDDLAALRRHEIAHLASFGFTAEHIADRLGMGVTTVAAILRELHTGTKHDRRKKPQMEVAA
jgi:transcriptional regulator with XRE-family HTH domain